MSYIRNLRAASLLAVIASPMWPLTRCQPAAWAQSAAPPAGPRTASRRAVAPLTRPEATAYRETSRYADVMEFLRGVGAGRRRMYVTGFGYSSEGRELPLVVVGEVTGPDPEAVLASGKLRIYLQGNIHAGEVEGKEALLMLVRDLARGAHAAWLDSVVLLIAPIYNADGNERIALTNRPLQNGPEGGMGQRANAQGLDLNRDHMKLESPEARSLARLLARYDPHVVVDLHTTDGSVHGYHLTYSVPLHPATDSSLVRISRDEWMPEVTRSIRERDGWEFYWYGNLPGGPGLGEGSAERGWYTFDHRPRFNNNYVGLRNRFAILSEAYSYAGFEERIRATLRFVEECVAFAYRRASDLRAATQRADVRSVVGDSLPLRARFRRGGPVEIVLGEVTEDRHPLTGQRVLRRREARRVETMTDFAWFEAAELERAPRAYFVPPDLAAVVDRLRAHGIATTRLERAVSLEGERYRVDTTWVAARAFQNHRERQARGAWEPARLELPAGTVVVRVAQPLGRLAFMLLEPRSDDGFLDWNFFDEALGAPRGAYPVVRSLSEF